MKHNYICIIKLPEEEETEQGTQNIFEEILANIFPNMVKEKDT